MYFEKRGALEIDFIMNLGGEVAAAAEVKSGNNTKSKSLNSLISGIDNGDTYPYRE